MNTDKLNDWLQMIAVVGVIAGLVLVAYEISVSNRIGLEQANAESLNRYGAVNTLFSNADAADIFVRAQEGDELSRQEMVRLDNMLNAWISALFYDWTLAESGTLSVEPGFVEFYAPAIQWFLGSEVGRRKWDTDSGDWDAQFAEIIESALAASKQRNVLGELDYLRGAADSIESPIESIPESGSALGHKQPFSIISGERLVSGVKQTLALQIDLVDLMRSHKQVTSIAETTYSSCICDALRICGDSNGLRLQDRNKRN